MVVAADGAVTTMEASTLRHDDGGFRNQIFAAPADDPRARRPADVVVLVVSLLAVFLLGWMYRSRVRFDTRVVEAFAEGVPSWLSGIATAVFLAGGLYAVGLILAVTVLGRGRLAIARDMLLAVGLGTVGIIISSYAASRQFPDLVPELTDRSEYPAFPVARLAAAVAAVGVAGPFLSLPMRRLGRRLISGMAVSVVILGYGTITSVIGGICLGVAGTAVVHLIFGSGLGIPSQARIMAALRDAHLDVTRIEYLDLQPVGATLVRAYDPAGRRLLVKVYGRDAANAAFAARAWRAAWYRGDSDSVTASRLQLAEHEALAMMAFERGGVSAPRLVTATRSSTDDVLVVSDWLDVTTLAAADDAVDEPNLDELWDLLGRTHDAGFTHGSIDRYSVALADGHAVFTDVRSASFRTDAMAVATDRAQLLVATALCGGIDAALDAAQRHLSGDDVAEVLPVLQTTVLPRSLQLEVHAHDLSIDDLRTGLGDRLGVEPPELAQLRRVSWGSVAMVVLMLFAAYSLITALTEIGFDSVADQYATAIWSSIAVAFILAQLTNVGEYVTLVGVTGIQVPFGPTLMFRYALSFISLAVPSEAGAIAMNIRYQQKLGIPAAAAVAQGPLLTLISKGFDVILLLVAAQFVGRTIDFDGADLGPVVRLVAFIVVAAVVAVVVVLVVPRFRSWALPHLREGFVAVRGSLTDPSRLGKIVAGTLMQKVLFAMTLSASVAAFGSDLPFGAALFVNTAVSLFVGLMPVPGGIGVGESALTAGLIAVGVPAEVALAAAITHRMVTTYLPPVFGWWSSRWLVGRGYL